MLHPPKRMPLHLKKGIPSRVINISSKRRKSNQDKIRIDKLLKKENPKILIKRRLGGIGDVIMSLPLVSEIKRLLPLCHLSYMTDTVYANNALQEVTDHCPDIDLTLNNGEDSQISFDYSVDITTTGLNREKANTIPPNRIDLFGEEAGVVISNPIPKYRVRRKETERAKKEIKTTFLKGKKREEFTLIFLQPRSNDERRTWPKIQVEELAKQLSERKDTIVLLFDWGGTIDSWKEKENLFIVKQRSIADTAAIMKECDIVICPDSSMLHLAGALNKKIVSIFGPIPPESRINHYPNASAVILGLPCQFCFYTPKCLRRTSDNQKLACLTKLSPELVIKEVEKKLKEKHKSRKTTLESNLTINKPILIKRSTRGIGDILMACNGIEALKNQFPYKEIHVAVHKDLIDIVSTNPAIDKVLDSSLPVNYLDYCKISDISFPCATYETSRIKTGRLVQKNRVEIYAEAIGSRSFMKDYLPKYYPIESEISKAKKYLKDKTDKNKKNLFIVLRSAEQYRNWPEENYLSLINKLKDSYNIILNSGKEYEDIINIGERSFREIASFIKCCDGVFTVDTGPLHAAIAMNISTVALFGPIDSRARCRGYGSLVTVIKSNLECIPCWRNRNVKCKHNSTNEGYSKCLEQISPTQVFNIIKGKI